MKLIMSDRPLDVAITDPAEVKYVDLSSLKIANCTGCFGCWTRTPGRCVIRDDATRVYPLIAASDTLLYCESGQVWQLRHRVENNARTRHSRAAGLYPHRSRRDPPCAAGCCAQRGHDCRLRRYSPRRERDIPTTGGPECPQHEFQELPHTFCL